MQAVLRARLQAVAAVFKMMPARMPETDTFWVGLATMQRYPSIQLTSIASSLIACGPLTFEEDH